MECNSSIQVASSSLPFLNFSVRQLSTKKILFYDPIPCHLCHSEREWVKGTGSVSSDSTFDWQALECHLSQNLSGIADSDFACPKSQFKGYNFNFPRTYFKNKCLQPTSRNRIKACNFWPLGGYEKKLSYLKQTRDPLH